MNWDFTERQATMISITLRYRCQTKSVVVSVKLTKDNYHHSYGYEEHHVDITCPQCGKDHRCLL